MDCKPTVRCFSPRCICSQITANTIPFEGMQYKLHIARNVYFCATVLYAFWDYEISKSLNGTGFNTVYCVS
jgi:hypothetical protein